MTRYSLHSSIVTIHFYKQAAYISATRALHELFVCQTQGELKKNLMKITITTVGKIKEKYLKDAIAEYSKRLSRYCKLEILEVADEVDTGWCK